MDNLIAIVIIVLIVGFALRYIIKAKKAGAKCIGCSYACECANAGKKCPSEEE